MECRYCRFYEYDRRIEACHSHGEVQIGRCLKNERACGNLTLSNWQGCEEWERRDPKYEKGQVFVGEQTWYVNSEERVEKRALCIITIRPEYAPNIYRVRDNRQSEYSMSEEDLDRYEIINLEDEK